jgi:hypothetical protein
MRIKQRLNNQLHYRLRQCQRRRMFRVLMERWCVTASPQAEHGRILLELTDQGILLGDTIAYEIPIRID